MARFSVDLRSDTVTTPSAAMRAAMADAEVGDDWYGDDPTVERLQRAAAERVGTEAALFVPTGVMGNQIALRLHQRGGGHLVVAEADAHVATTEVASSAVLSGISYRTIRGDHRGQLSAEQVREALRPDVLYDADMVDLVAVENTHSVSGGSVMAVETLRGIRAAVDEAGVGLHLDGARLFNAAAAAGLDVTAWTSMVDTVMFCLSKGLGAPIGSMICGPSEWIREARRLRILFGGAWRQAGILAAAGLVALERGPGRLHEDHARARRLADGVAARLPGSVDPTAVETNMVFVRTTETIGLDPLEVAARLGREGVGATVLGGRLRMVTHLDIDDAAIDRALAAWDAVIREAA